MDVKDCEESEEWAEQALTQVNKMIINYVIKGDKTTKMSATDTLMNIFDLVRVVCPMIQVVDLVKGTPKTE